MPKQFARPDFLSRNQNVLAALSQARCFGNASRFVNDTPVHVKIRAPVDIEPKQRVWEARSADMLDPFAPEAAHSKRGWGNAFIPEDWVVCIQEQQRLKKPEFFGLSTYRGLIMICTWGFYMYYVYEICIYPDSEMAYWFGW